MAQTFKTAISIVSGAASSQAVAARVDGDSQNRINIDAGGKITWGSGSAAGDTTLYRSAADLLKTDDAFEAASLSVAGEFTLPTVDGSSGQVLSTDGTGSVSWTTADHGSLAGLGDDDHTQYPKLTNSDTAPSSPRVNDMWYDTTNGRTYVYYDSFWVEMGSGSGEILLDNISDVNAGAPATGEVLTYNGTDWSNGPGHLVAAASTGSNGHNGGFFPGASMVAQLSNTSHGINQKYLYWTWCSIQKELTITGLFIDVQTAYDPSDLMRIGLFSYDLNNLSTQYDTVWTFTLYHDFGTLPLSAVGEQAIDISSSPLVVPPGLYAVGTAAAYTSSIPTVNGASLAFMHDVPSSLTTVSTGIRSYSSPRNSANWTTSVNDGFPTTPITASNGSAAPVPFQHGATVVFFRGYTSG